MSKQLYLLDHISISVKSHRLLQQLLDENPRLAEIISSAKSFKKAQEEIKSWILPLLKKNKDAYLYYTGEVDGRDVFKKLQWKDYAIIRILDYINHADFKYKDLNIQKAYAYSNPFKMLWLAANKGGSGAKPAFFLDMIYLFRQLTGKFKQDLPKLEQNLEWMEKWRTGLDTEIKELHQANKKRIIKRIIKNINKGNIQDSKYFFKEDEKEKYQKVLEWWEEKTFHLRFAIKKADTLNEYLDCSIDPDTMDILYEAENKGIPFFINPYYLSLVLVDPPTHLIGLDMPIRNYMIYSKELIDEYGNIRAWEKEDEVRPGKPNAAGWILPTRNNVHRRYPEVAILIPDTMGKACGGLCASCQRMYDFQSGNLNFNLDKLRPKQTWDEKLKKLLSYFENDSQLRDILITGGDALMSSDKSLEKIFNGIYEMALRKIEANKKRPEKEKYAEILRIRLGTRLPVYLPQRITDDLIHILKEFKEKASAIGIKKFIIQTHFESPIEITPEAKQSIEKLISAGWIVTNQHVFIASSSRRGHANKLRQALNQIGVLTYYNFSVKGYHENTFNFATNERAVQEQLEEKIIGEIKKKDEAKLIKLLEDTANITDDINLLREEIDIPFLSTDRNVLNLPGVGKSLSYRTIGITRYGRRILKFEHDKNRTHSPVVDKMEDVIIIESKSIAEYLDQLDSFGEDIKDYEGVWGYSISETEERSPIFEYPEYDYSVTRQITNLEI